MSLLSICHFTLRKIYLALCVSILLFSNTARAQFLMMPDSTNNRIVLFNPFDGSVVNSNYFGLAAGTPIHAMQVGNEIWVSEQIGDRISRWSLTGASLGAITGALDNVRGMEQVGNTVYLATTGTANGAPGRAVAMFDPTGASQGTFATPLSSGFGILFHQGDLLVSSDTANDDIHVYSTAGADKGTFHNSTALNFGEQMDHATNGDVLVAAFSSNQVARLDPMSGNIISTFAASGARGVFQLGNGNIMWTSGAGASVFDVATQTSSLVYTGGGRFLDVLNVPEPTSGMFLLAGVGAIVAKRRRR
ncbi:hypothetical protein BH09PLA1_BH09PLA1_01070 [soil metagenome]